MAEESKGGSEAGSEGSDSSQSNGSQDSSGDNNSSSTDTESQNSENTSEEQSEGQSESESQDSQGNPNPQYKSNKKQPKKNRLYGGNKVYIDDKKPVERYENGQEIIIYDTPVSEEVMNSISPGELERRVANHQRFVGRNPVAAEALSRASEERETSSPYRSLLEDRANGKNNTYEPTYSTPPTGRQAMSSGRLVVLGPGFTRPTYRLN